jgi:hypothetical protein
VPQATVVPRTTIQDDVEPETERHAGGDSAGAGTGDEEEKGSTGLLVAAIIFMVLVCGLFVFLIYTEKKRKDVRRARMATASGVKNLPQASDPRHNL